MSKARYAAEAAIQLIITQAKDWRWCGDANGSLAGQGFMEHAVYEEKQRLLMAGLEKVKQSFVSSLPVRVQKFDALMDDLYNLEVDINEITKQIGHHAHQLHGQAGSFGYNEIGAIAAELEMSVASFLEGSEDFGTENVEVQLIALLDQINASLKAA